MNFIEIQITIFLSVILLSLIGGKKISLLAIGFWIIETLMVYILHDFNYLQIITLALSFQVGMLIAVTRDFIIKKFKKIKSTSSTRKEVS